MQVSSGEHETNYTDSPPPGFRALLQLAWPLILSSSFNTIQITVDRLFLSRIGPEVAAAATGAAINFWLPYILLFSVASYTATFVSQYIGAKRPHRVGIAVWHGIYFSIAAGLLILVLIPFSLPIYQKLGHAPDIALYESQYFNCLCWYALPGLLTATISAYFSGRNEGLVVVWISAIGTAVNVVLDYLLILGRFGIPSFGILGAGYATVAATWVSALFGVCWMLRKKYRREHQTARWLCWDKVLAWRFLRFGGPSGVQWMLDVSAFNAFIIIAGWFGAIQFAATTLAITINNFAFIPMIGVGQAVAVFVGRHLGEDRPDLAQRMFTRGMAVAVVYNGTLAMFYLFLPYTLTSFFKPDQDNGDWLTIMTTVRWLLVFVCIYACFDALNIVLSFGLRGAGDTVFVSLVSLFLAWPILVLPSYLSYRYG
ncbi:MAG: MATE family efflux transporter [Zavarzinella sp.]